MQLQWYRHDQETVLSALAQGERPAMATTRGCGVLDELVALHAELGVLSAVDELEGSRIRAGVPDTLLLRTAASLPFLAAASLSGAAHALFAEPAVLLQLGWAPVQLREGPNGRHRAAAGRQEESVPCHPDTLRDALRRITATAWQQAQEAGVRALYARRLVRGTVYAIDGSGLGDGLRVVALVCVSAEHPVLVAWRLLEGSASEKGKEASVTRTLIEQALALGGAGCVRLLLADALYADGPLLAWLKYAKGIDALVRLPADRLRYADVAELAQAGLIPWQTHRYTRVLQGHKELRTVAVTAAGALTSWDGFVEAAARYGVADASLWACLLRDAGPDASPDPQGLVSTCSWPSGYAALQAFRPRWHIEDDTFRELKEGFGLEAQPWGRAAAMARVRLTLTALAFNTVQV
jgi:hypothetical protein